MTAILASDVFPSLESHNPLSTTEFEEIPARFGANWFEEERKENVFKEDSEPNKNMF